MMTAPSIICERCRTEPADGWPGSKGGELCQMCFEDECSDAWWDEVKRIGDYWWTFEVPPSMTLAAALNMAHGTEGIE